MNSIFTDAIAAIRRRRPRRIVILSGAGISAESGIPVFRGAGGLWENHRPEELATPQAFTRDPHLVWRWYEWRRGLIRNASPNAAHTALVRLQNEAGLSAVVVTQNVDGLHSRAGSRAVVELHGNIMEVRCTGDGTVSLHDSAFEALPPCCSCGALLRPNVVWFGEALPPDAWKRAVDSVTAADLVLVIGTSGVVYPAAGLVGYAGSALTIEVNPDLSAETSPCDFAVKMKAGEATPALVEAILESLP